ncbi:MAG: UTRA domain-containing protein [Gammaproteobacteria bacterium]|nr:UTRA domain-containing protein [Gammaproteobacteria bacterium]
MNTTTLTGAGPLYSQVEAILLARIGAGEWQPGESLPGEQRLAAALNVSQGTVRKAIDSLVSNNVLVRQQGKGTFVATHDEHRELFHFFHLVGNDGSRVRPASQVLSCQRLQATRAIAAALDLRPRQRIIQIERVRTLRGVPAIAETITVAADRFPDLGKRPHHQLPNTLYALYEQRYGVTIHRAEEKLRAIAADARDASLLHHPQGYPLLEITRLALALDAAPVELRVSRCDSAHYHYVNSIV